MVVGLYVRYVTDELMPRLEPLIRGLAEQGLEVVYIRQDILEQPIDFIISVGGDGTLLDAAHLIGAAGIPVLGLNWGHLGFLTTVDVDETNTLAAHIAKGEYDVEERTLLSVDYSSAAIQDPYTRFALNEIYVHRQSQPSLLQTDLFVEDEYVATYASDGLIVATPTGSTAYSLSCGGPILTPTSASIVVTPVAAHTLTLRPIILPDDANIKLLPHMRTHQEFCLGVDSRTILLPDATEVCITKAPFKLLLVRMKGQSFFTAMRDKLSWGK